MPRTKVNVIIFKFCLPYMLVTGSREMLVHFPRSCCLSREQPKISERQLAFSCGNVQPQDWHKCGHVVDSDAALW